MKHPAACWTLHAHKNTQKKSNERLQPASNKSINCCKYLPSLHFDAIVFCKHPQSMSLFLRYDVEHCIFHSFFFDRCLTNTNVTDPNHLGHIWAQVKLQRVHEHLWLTWHCFDHEICLHSNMLCVRKVMKYKKSEQIYESTNICGWRDTDMPMQMFAR